MPYSACTYGVVTAGRVKCVESSTKKATVDCSVRTSGRGGISRYVGILIMRAQNVSTVTST